MYFIVNTKQLSRSLDLKLIFNFKLFKCKVMVINIVITVPAGEWVVDLIGVVV